MTTIVPSKLTILTKFAFGTGHVFNDMCASMWFIYSLYFFTKVVHLSDAQVMSLIVIYTAKL